MVSRFVPRSQRESHSQKKVPQSTSAPVQNQLRSRPFAPPQTEATPQAEVPDLQTQLDNANRLGHSFSKMFASRTSTTIQPKLTIGAPGDQYEQEADRVAQQVVRRINAPQLEQPQPAQAVQRETLPEEELQMKPLADQIQRVDMPEDDELQRASMADQIQREDMPDEDELQMKPMADQIQREDMPEDDELQMKPMVQRQATAAAGVATPALESTIQQACGGGQPLGDTIRQPMEQAFGADFSGIKVHTDSQSDQLNRSLQAKAFTTGQDVFFRQGAYEPGSQGGQELLAHELTHVVQQNADVVSRKTQVKPEATAAGGAASHGAIAPTPTLGTPLIQRQLMSTDDLTQDGGAPGRLPSKYKDVCNALKDYHQETSGKNRILVRMQLLETLSGDINRWTVKNAGATSAQATAVSMLQGQVITELQLVGNELVALKDFDATKEDPSAIVQKPRTLDPKNAVNIPDLKKMWTRKQFNQFTYESMTAGQGGISEEIAKLLDVYHSNEEKYHQAYNDGKEVEKTLKILTAGAYKKHMEAVFLYRIRLETWIAMIKNLATSWLTGHEGDTWRKNRYLAMLKFLAVCQTVVENLVTDYPLLPEHPEIYQSLVTDKSKLDDQTGAYKSPAELKDLKQQLKYTNPEAEKAFGAVLAKYNLLSKKYEGSFDSCLTKMAPLLNSYVPNLRDKHELKADLMIPIPKTYGIGAIAVTAQLKLENKEAGENPKIKVHGNFSLGLGVQFPPEFKLLQAYLRAELGAYIEAQGRTSEEVMMLISYGMYRRFRESKGIPSSVTDAMWGKGKSGVAKYRSAEQWSAAVEKDVFGSEMGIKKSDDLYVDTGGLGRAKGLIKGDVGIAKLGGSGEIIGTSGKRYNSKTIATAINKGIPPKDETEVKQLLESGQKKYVKQGGFINSKRQKAQGKHYATFVTEVEGNFKVKTLIGVKVAYKQTREWSGDDDNISTRKLGESWLAKTKHEINFTITGVVASSLMSLADPLIQGLQEVARSQDEDKLAQEQDPGKKKVLKDKVQDDKSKLLFRIENSTKSVLASIADPVANQLSTSKDMATALGDVIGDAGIGFDVNLEYKWAKDKDIPAERKVELDLRNVQEIKIKPSIIPGGSSLLGSHTEFKSAKRAGIFGTVYKEKSVTNPADPKDFKYVRADVVDLINAEIKVKKETDSLGKIVFQEPDKFKDYVEKADEKKKTETYRGMDESTSPLFNK